MKKITLFSILLFLNIFSIRAQDDIKNYKEPEVTEGSSLRLSSNPSYLNRKEFSNSNTTYDIDLNLRAKYTKWKFTPRLNYVLNMSLDGSIDKYNYDYQIYADNVSSTFSTYLSTNLNAGASYYLTKNIFYTGLFLNANDNLANHHNPFYYFFIY